jgi:hypothetical protein
MTTLYIDLETIPDQSPGARQEFIDNVQAPGNYKKPESIAKWLEDNAESIGDKEYRDTSFDGMYGQICVIGWALDGGEINSVSYRDDFMDEKSLLISFFNQLSDQLGTVDQRIREGCYIPIDWCAHNGTNFDFRFLWQRCVINGVKPSVRIPYDAKPWGDVIDTLYLWKGVKTKGGSLDAICKAFGIPGKGDMDGSKVWDAVKNGEIDKIAEYCRDDVDKLRQIHKRMMFL